jgi:tetratricopeptide (TPR) repeat protein
MKLAAAARFLERSFWPELFERATHEPAPPPDTHVRLVSALRETCHGDRAVALAAEAMDDEDALADPHPPLPDRLRALGVDPAEVRLEPAPDGVTAAEALLGPLGTRALATFDEEWRSSVADAWRQEHQRAEEARRRLAELDARAEREELPVEDARMRALLTATYRGDDDALPLLRAVVEREPNEAAAHFALGRILIARGDEQGLAHVERAAELDPDAILPASEVAYAFLKERGRDGAADAHMERAQARAAELEAARRERETVEPDDDVTSAELPQDSVDAVRRRLAVEPEVVRAYLGRKVVQHLPDEYPLYVVGIERESKRDKHLVRRLVDHLELPGAFFVIALDGTYAPLGRTFEARPELKIYERGQPLARRRDPGAEHDSAAPVG